MHSMPESPFRRVLFMRLDRRTPPTPDALVAVIDILGAWWSEARLVCAGDPPRPVELSSTTLKDYSEEVEQARLAGFPALFQLASDPSDNPDLVLFQDVEAGSLGEREVIWFPLPADLSADRFRLERLLDLFGALGSALNATQGHIENDQLLALVRGKRAAERARSMLPPDLRAFVPPPPIPPAAGSLPEMLLPDEFDYRRVPDAIWWVNYWNRERVAIFGMEQVQSAGWASARDLSRCMGARCGWKARSE